MTKGMKLLYDRSVISLAVDTVVDAILTDFRKRDLRNAGLVGIQSKGALFAGRIRDAIAAQTGITLELATLDITMYRDDIGVRKTLPEIMPTDIPFDINDKAVILVDDVLHTGRTIRAALDAITDYGRPAMIRLAVMIDRGEREFPIRADYTGLNVDSGEGKRLKIFFGEDPNEDAIYEVNVK